MSDNQVLEEDELNTVLDSIKARKIYNVQIDELLINVLVIPAGILTIIFLLCLITAIIIFLIITMPLTLIFGIICTPIYLILRGIFNNKHEQ